MNRGLLPTAMLLAAFTASDAGAAEYKGICEASAGPSSTALTSSWQATRQTSFRSTNAASPTDRKRDRHGDLHVVRQTDLEAAAVIGDRVYWISSHSFNSQGEDKSKRKVFFATKIVQADGKPTLVSVGKPVKSLRDPLAKAAGVKPSEMNIEALTATPDGGLLIGLRARSRGMGWMRSRTRRGVDEQHAPDFGAAVRQEEDRGSKHETIGADGTIRHRRGPFRQGGGIALFDGPAQGRPGSQRRGLSESGGGAMRPGQTVAF